MFLKIYKFSCITWEMSFSLSNKRNTIKSLMEDVFSNWNGGYCLNVIIFIYNDCVESEKLQLGRREIENVLHTYLLLRNNFSELRNACKLIQSHQFPGTDRAQF